MRAEPASFPSRRSNDAGRRIRDLIRADMHRGAYADGRLPSEELLMRQMHVSRAVIRAAFELLRAEGLIDRIQGVGTVVVVELRLMTLEQSQGVSPPDPADPIARTRPQILDSCAVELPPPIARHLGVAANSDGVRIDYVAQFDGRPLGLVTNYMRMPEAAALASARFTSSYYTYLRDAGLETSETTYLMEAALADETDAALLGVAVGAPMMVAEQALFNPAGESFNYAFVRSRGDASAILSRVARARAASPVNGGSAADHP
jgi:GntR family transcriptional regulator